MASEKVLYWMAVAVMALFVGNHFAKKYDRVQEQFASMEAGMAHQQTACARVQAQHARMMALEQMQNMRVRVICPRRRVRVEIPQGRAVVHDGTI
jgi:hypothetical protein